MVNLNSTKVLIISVALLIIVSMALVYYYNSEIDALNTQIIVLNKEIITKLDNLREDLDSEISSLNANLSADIDSVDVNLNNFKIENNKDINSLNSLIDEIEKQSEIELGQLKEELKNIQVESTDFSVIIDDVIQSVVSVGTNKGVGSGAVIDDRGFIVTNYHVVNDVSIIRILTYDENVYDAELIGFNDVIDVAVLKVDADLIELRFDDSDKVDIGERVIALGNPAGLSFTVTEGIVSAVHRVGPNNLNIYIQTDVPINPGNSGGPLVNTNSRIIGLNNFKISGFEGLGFAIESNSVKEVVDDIIAQYLEQQ